MDDRSLNYNPNANVDDGSCTYAPEPVYGCTDPYATNYNSQADHDDGSCNYDVLGCTDPYATNWDPLATIDDGRCVYPAAIPGCTNLLATNYNPLATVDDKSCIMPDVLCSDNPLAVLAHTFTANIASVHPLEMISDFIIADPLLHPVSQLLNYYEFPALNYFYTNDSYNTVTGNYQRRITSWRCSSTGLSATNPWAIYILTSGSSNIHFYTWTSLLNWVNASGIVSVSSGINMAALRREMNLPTGNQIHPLGSSCN
jgi:hypothetical protein